MIKDPDTGKRVSRVNPESEWQRSDVPHLAIVEPELWEQVQAIKIKRGHAKPAYRRKPKHMLSGLLRCGSCKGGMSIKGVDRGGTRIVCTQMLALALTSGRTISTTSSRPCLVAYEST